VRQENGGGRDRAAPRAPVHGPGDSSARPVSVTSSRRRRGPRIFQRLWCQTRRWLRPTWQWFLCPAPGT